MTRIALAYGGISGLIVIASIILGMSLGDNGGAGTQWLGYLIMLVALTMIFIGVKRWRDQDHAGRITFLQGLMMGLAIALVATIIYVIVWEIYLAFTGNAFINSYIDSTLEALRASDASQEEISAQISDLESLRANYANPLYRLPVTFSEIFPVGAIIAAISALVLRNPNILPARTTQENA